MIVNDLLELLDPNTEVVMVHKSGKITKGFCRDLWNCSNTWGITYSIVSISCLDNSSILIVVND